MNLANEFKASAYIDHEGEDGAWLGLFRVAKRGVSPEEIGIRLISINKDGRVAEIKLGLAFRSRFWACLLELWPPDTVWDFRSKDGALEIYFPYVSEDERNLVPFGLDRDALWQGRLEKEHSRWRLRKLGALSLGAKLRARRQDPRSLVEIGQERFEHLIAEMSASY